MSLSQHRLFITSTRDIESTECTKSTVKLYTILAVKWGNDLLIFVFTELKVHLMINYSHEHM